MRHALIDHSHASSLPRAAMGPATRLDWWAARRLQEAIRPAAVRVVLWDGRSPFDGGPAIGDLVVHNRRALLEIGRAHV